MYKFPETEKKLRNRIASYKSALLKEQKKFGYIDDSEGKRYLLFALYFVLNDAEEARDYCEWYKKEFSDDVGEPIQKLCWAVSLRRWGSDSEARRMLVETMLSNLYLIPGLLGREVKEYDMWHSSSEGLPGYLAYLPKEVINAMTGDEAQWLSHEYDSPDVTHIRERYVDIYRALKVTNGLDDRRRLIAESNSLLDGF